PPLTITLHPRSCDLHSFDLCCFLHFPSLLFFFNDPATTEIYTLSLHDALPIFTRCSWRWASRTAVRRRGARAAHCASTCVAERQDRKSTRLNSSHDQISYAVFCLKKKKKKQKNKQIS